MTFGRFFAWTVAVAVILAACATPPPAPEEDFGFSLSETTLAAVPGTSVTTSATIIPDNGFTGIVALAISDQNGHPCRSRHHPQPR